MTQAQLIIEYLKGQEGWIPSWKLGKLNTELGWIGSSGERTARNLAANDCIKEHIDHVKKRDGRVLLSQGTTLDALNDKVNRTYVYYRFSHPTRKVLKGEIVGGVYQCGLVEVAV